MRTAYLCGPISKGGTLTPERRKMFMDKFADIRQRLAPTTKVLDPTLLPKQERWEDYMKLTIPMLCEADFLVLLPGWEDSQGAMLEVFLAKTLDIPIMFSDHLPI